MTSAEAVKRAKSHSWTEVNDQTEFCTICHLMLPKAVNLENVPACPGRVVNWK